MNRLKTFGLNLDIWFSQRLRHIGKIRSEMKANPKFCWMFWIFFFIPVVLFIALFVVLPLFSDPWMGFQEKNRKEQYTTLNNQMTEEFLKTRLDLAKSDSVYLIVNLEDSLASLTIRGVPVRECPISRIRFSQAFRHGVRSGAIGNWLSEPFVLQNAWSTIPKSILHVKTAPRDTLEAQKNYREPTTPVENEDIFVTMYFDRHLELKIAQNKRPGIIGIVKRSIIQSRYHLFRFLAEVKRVCSKKIPVPSLWIRIEVGRDDVRALYRALPREPRLVLRFPAPIEPEASQVSQDFGKK